MSLPRWTWRRAVVELLCALGLAWYAHHHPGPPVSMAFWGIFVSIFEAIFTGLKAAGDALIVALETAVKWLRSRLFDLGRLLGTGIAVVGKAMATVADAIVKAFTNGIIPGFQQLWGWVKDGIDLLQRGLSTVIGWVVKFRGWIANFYTTWVRPVTDAIDKVRRALDILAHVGVGAAADLARRLSLVEQKIQQPFLDLVGKVNEILGVLNRVLTLNGLIQKITLFGSLFQERKAFTNFTINQLFKATTGAAGPTTIALTSEEQLQQDITDITQLATQPYSATTPAQQEWVDDLTQKIAQAL